jgi:antitoxin component of MazEF toxin-antitoxin module
MKSIEKNVRKITKVGSHSYAVIIPISVIRDWRWKERQKVVLEIDDNKKVIKIKDWKKK